YGPCPHPTCITFEQFAMDPIRLALDRTPRQRPHTVGTEPGLLGIPLDKCRGELGANHGQDRLQNRKVAPGPSTNVTRYDGNDVCVRCIRSRVRSFASTSSAWVKPTQSLCCDP